jgi:hypothetical protein
MSENRPELILHMGVEGGGVSVTRRLGSDGAWRFDYHGSSMLIDPDEEWIGFNSVNSKQPNGYVTLEDAIAGFSSHGDWVRWSPIEVHADYKDHVWKLRERIIASRNDSERTGRPYLEKRWARACGKRFPLDRPNPAVDTAGIVVRPGGPLDLILGASIAVLEHLRKEPMSVAEVAEFEASMISVLERRKADRQAAARSRRLRQTPNADE